MLKFLFTNIFLILTYYSYGQAPVFEWAELLEPVPGARIEISGMVTDNAGNVYYTGLFYSTVDFDPGPGTVNLTANLFTTSAFITKIAPSGALVWAKKIDGTAEISPNDIAIDQGGFLYITGKFEATYDFDPGPAIYNLSTFYNWTYDSFVLKLNADGNFVWVKQFASASGQDNRGISITLDNSGNIYVGGLFTGTVDFDPGPAVVEMSNFISSAYIIKLTATGDFSWVKQIAGPFNFSISFNGLGLSVAGNFQQSFDVDPGLAVHTLTPIGQEDYFISNFDLNGNLTWVKAIGGVESDRIFSMITDRSGNIYLTGQYVGTTDFDPGPAVYNITSFSGQSSGFLSKYDKNGNFVLAKAFGSSGLSVCLDYLKNIYVAGDFVLPNDFDPGPGIFNMTAQGDYNTYILKLNQAGEFIWAKAFFGGSNTPGSIAVDPFRNIYTDGGFVQVPWGIVDFDPGAGIFNFPLPEPGVFLHKMNQPCFTNTTSILNINSCNDYTLNDETYSVSGTYTQVVQNASGCDSIITINLSINKKSSSKNIAICEGQSYFAGGSNQTTAGVYIDTLQTTNNCDSIITTTLVVNPKPVPDLGQDRKLCQNTSTSATPGTFNSYIWNDLSIAPSLLISTSGTYWVTVKDANNCTATDSLLILSIDTLPVNFLPADQQICLGNSYIINVVAYKNYLWNTGATGNSITVKNLGTYYLSVTDNNGCVGKDTIQVTQKNDCIPFNIPNAFTPNNDRRNDIFKPIINQDITDYSFSIFNRYGEKIFETKTYPSGWDGTYKGKNQPTGSYIYIIYYRTANGWLTEEKGTVTLLR